MEDSKVQEVKSSKFNIKTARNVGYAIVVIGVIVFFVFAGMYIERTLVPSVNKWLYDHNFPTIGEYAPKKNENPLVRLDDTPKLNDAPSRNYSSGEIIPKIVRDVSPSVVSIAIADISLEKGRGLVEDTSKIGTGFVIDSKGGIIITNQHVVSNNNAEYRVVTNTNDTFTVKKIVRDETNDIALLLIDAKNLKAVDLGDSDNIEVGQTVIAIGTPLGEFPGSVTVGVISGLKRSVTTGGGFFTKGKVYENVIQTDAAVNPGNSGGPLINLEGKVVGVNFATTSGADNISFALPINIVKQRVAEYKEFGKFKNPFLGVNYQNISEQQASFYGVVAGALVYTVVPNSPADKAGIKPYDIIVEYNGNKVSEHGLAELIQKSKIGDKVKLKLWRTTKITNKSEYISVEVIIGERE